MSIICSPFLGNGTINPNLGSWPKCRKIIPCPLTSSHGPSPTSPHSSLFLVISSFWASFPVITTGEQLRMLMVLLLLLLAWLKCRIQIEMLVLTCHLGMSSWVWNELFSHLDPDGSAGDVPRLSWDGSPHTSPLCTDFFGGSISPFANQRLPVPMDTKGCSVHVWLLASDTKKDHGEYMCVLDTAWQFLTAFLPAKSTWKNQRIFTISK